MVKPLQTLKLIAAVGALGLLLMAVFPDDGVQVGSIKMEFPSYAEFFGKDTALKGQGVDVQTLLNAYEFPVDSTAIRDSLKAAEIAFRRQMLKLQYPEGSNWQVLKPFYEGLMALQGSGKKIRILHFGDSQIEGDSITSFVREQLQSNFGGMGPGYLQLYEVIPNFSIRQAQSENWLRYTSYGRRSAELNHTRYGLWGSFSRFNAFVADSLVDSTAQHTAWVRLNPSRLGFKHVKSYSQLHLHFGNLRTPMVVKVYEGNVVLETRTFQPQKSPQKAVFQFVQTPQDLLLEFESADSPDFYGLSLESGSGVVLDNIAMRGSSGTVFTNVSGEVLGGMMRREPVRLVILQYGGNTVPHIESKEKADKYGEWFGSQIAQLKKFAPDAAFILIGPSDMSTKVKDQYTTFPYLVEVRDALKRAAHAHGAAYWDLFEVMGGRNSMPGWVQADPPLASPDYVHFTPNGARKVAGLFHNALMEDFEKFKVQHQKTALIKAAQPRKEKTAPVKIDSVEAQ